MSEQLDEVFDSEETLPAINLNPKLKVPQIWAIGDIEDNLVARMVSYTSEGDAIKQVKMGDKYAHVILMSLSAKGTPAELKGGLGASPIASINSIFDVVYEQVKKLRMDAIMFRFPTKKMKGQGPIVQRVIQRVVTQRGGGRFKVVPAMFQFTGKHTYILVVRKGADIDDIKGMPGINAELYTKVDSDVGDVYISKKDGVQVTKETAVAGSIAQVEEKRRDLAVIKRTKISRRQIAKAQSLESNRFEDQSWAQYDDTAGKFSAPATATLDPKVKELELVNSTLAKGHLVDWVTRYLPGQVRAVVNAKENENEITDNNIKNDINDSVIKMFRDTDPQSVDALKGIAEIMNRNFERYKNKHKWNYKNVYAHLPPEQAAEMTEKSWAAMRLKFLQQSLKYYADIVSRNTNIVLQDYTPKQYTPAEKGAIKEYCGSGYRDINDMLLGRYDPEGYETLHEPDVKQAITRLDSAFEKGDRLPEGITLYRAQTMRMPIYEAMVKNKVFYFRNYVSTSIFPIIFGGWKGTVAAGMLPDGVRDEYNVDKNGAGVVIPDVDIGDMKFDVETVRVSMGWAIKGGHKINVVIPGNLSIQPQEQEIVLPRGTMVQVNKITDASYTDGMVRSNNKFIEGEIMTSDQLDEATVVYDGDALVETGKLVEYYEGSMDDATPEEVEVSFDSFAKSTRLDGLALVAEVMDLNDIPERFIQG